MLSESAFQDSRPVFLVARQFVDQQRAASIGPSPKTAWQCAAPSASWRGASRARHTSTHYYRGLTQLYERDPQSVHDVSNRYKVCAISCPSAREEERRPTRVLGHRTGNNPSRRYGQVGSAPRRSKIKMMSRIVPSGMVHLTHQTKIFLGQFRVFCSRHRQLC